MLCSVSFWNPQNDVPAMFEDLDLLYGRSIYTNVSEVMYSVLEGFDIRGCESNAVCIYTYKC